jgi:hypothetical protein
MDVFRVGATRMPVSSTRTPKSILIEFEFSECRGTLRIDEARRLLMRCTCSRTSAENSIASRRIHHRRPRSVRARPAQFDGMGLCVPPRRLRTNGMNDELDLHVQISGGAEARWQISIEGDGPWHLRLKSPDGIEAAAVGSNAFEALRSIREQLAPRGIIMCCNGARVDVRPSGFSASHGAWMIYVLRMWRPPTVRDLVPIFGYAHPSKVGSVEEQDAYWERHLKNRKNLLNFINPVWWVYFLTASRGKPKGFNRR